MAVQIPFPVPSHGYALNSKLRINLDYIVQQFNQFNTGSATWDTVAIGIANSETGILQFLNASNANFLNIQAGATSASITYTLPATNPVNPAYQFLMCNAAGTMHWSALNFPDTVVGNQLLYVDGASTLKEVAVGTGVKIIVNSSPPTFVSLLGTSNQIIVTPNVGNITLSLPQSIGTASNVTFNQLIVDGGSATNPGLAVIFSGASTNTGLFSLSGTSLSVTVAGTSRGSWDNTGNYTAVGSITSPTYRATTSYTLSTGASGIVTIQALSSGGTYTLTLPTDDGNLNEVLTTNGSGVLSWQTIASAGGATKALDNLASVAINTSLLPASDNAIDLGSSSKEFRTAYLKTSLIFQETGAGTDTITIQAPSSIASGYTLTLPIDDGNSNEVLSTNGSGVLSWVTAGSLSGTVNSGTATQIAYYATTGTAISGNASFTISSTPNVTLSADLNGSDVNIQSINTHSSGSSGGGFLAQAADGGGDAYTLYKIQTGSPIQYKLGIDNSDSDKFKISVGNALGTNDVVTIDSSNNFSVLTTATFSSVVLASNGTAGATSYGFTNDTDSGMYRTGSHGIALATNSVDALKIDSAQRVSQPAQPCFLALSSSDQTNATGNTNADVTVVFGSEVYDIGGNFASNTFTAPITGKYAFWAQIRVSGLTAAMTTHIWKIKTTARQYDMSAGLTPTVAGSFAGVYTYQISCLADMTVGDTAIVTLNVIDGASNAVTIVSSAVSRTYFAGTLIN